MKIKNKENEFYIVFNEKKAKLVYEIKNGVLDIKKVFVPKEKRGKGLAKKLTKKCFEYAKENKLKVKLTCSYVKNKFMPEHKNYQNITV